MSDPTEPPPPPYDEAIRFRDTPSLSASDPLLGRRDEADQNTSSSARRSQQYLSGQHAGSSQSTRYVSDSPTSSDDEETAMLKAELRRLREKDSNEQKKALLRQMIEEERGAAGFTPGGVTPAAPHQWHPPPTAQHNYPGAIIYPMTSNIPGQSGGRATGPQPYAAPLQCPTAAGQIPGPSAAAGPMDSPDQDSTTNSQSTAIFFCFAVFFFAAMDTQDGKEDSGCMQCLLVMFCTAIITGVIVAIIVLTS